MRRIATILTGLAVVAALGFAAASGADTRQVGEALPLAPPGITEPDPADQVLFIEGEPITPFDGGSVGPLPVVGGELPLAPEGMPEPDISDQGLFPGDEPATGIKGDAARSFDN